mmetsp:Transcript_36532/g.56092  ORF Transcript_36532/g.56092 Transcript_36532/m.56092 type:complete len:85 (-) Transcript_36532:281-535(-)
MAAVNLPKQYALGVLREGDLVLGVVSEVMNYDIKNEFDPMLIERMKNCLRHMKEQDFVRQLKFEVLLTSTLFSKESRASIIKYL